MNDNAAGEVYDSSGADLRSAIEEDIVSLKAKGRKKEYKHWKSKVDDLDRYS